MSPMVQEHFAIENLCTRKTSKHSKMLLKLLQNFVVQSVLLSSTESNNPQTHTHMTQRITILSQGAKSKMYTLWNYNVGSAYCKPQYIKNLSTDYDTALMLAEQFAERAGRELWNDAMESLKPILRSQQMTPTMVKFGKNKGVELKDCEPKFIIWVAKGCPLYSEKYEDWCNYSFGGSDFESYAQSLAIELGLGVMHKEKFYTTEQYQKVVEKEQLMSSLVNGHHNTDGQRLDLTLTCIKQTGYESQYGFISVYTFIDADKKVYTYKGGTLTQTTKNIEGTDTWDTQEGVSKDMTITCKATIKHSTYKDEPVTFIQRLKIADINKAY
jgi:hypothetical protein